ncbi:MAG: hypothetical protein HXY45_02835 [Syntrophaceae bacterium]|nr:hypothetical protein [Syntrophaceae bacterium]
MGKRPPPSLLMVGTVHRDPRGKAKLLRLLQREKPSAVSVEISPYARIFRSQKAAAFRALLRENLGSIHREDGLAWGQILSHSAIQGIFLLLKEPYEWRAAMAYMEETGCKVLDIDLSEYSEEKLSHLSELISRENLRTLLSFSSSGLDEQVKQQYGRARFLFSHPPSVWLDSRELRERESIMAERIRGFVLQGEGEKFAHVGGWEHLLETNGQNSLYNLLKDLRPRRVLLAHGET